MNSQKLAQGVSFNISESSRVEAWLISVFILLLEVCLKSAVLQSLWRIFMTIFMSWIIQINRGWNWAIWLHIKWSIILIRPSSTRGFKTSKACRTILKRRRDLDCSWYAPLTLEWHQEAIPRFSSSTFSTYQMIRNNRQFYRRTISRISSPIIHR